MELSFHDLLLGHLATPSLTLCGRHMLILPKIEEEEKEAATKKAAEDAVTSAILKEAATTTASASGTEFSRKPTS